MRKRLLSILLVLFMVFTMMPVSADSVITENLLLNPGGEVYSNYGLLSDNGWKEDASTKRGYSYDAFLNTNGITLTPKSGTYFMGFYAVGGTTYPDGVSCYQDINVSDQTAYNLSGYLSVKKDTTGSAMLQLDALDSSGNVTKLAEQSVKTVDGDWKSVILSGAIPPSTAKLRVIIKGVLNNNGLAAFDDLSLVLSGATAPTTYTVTYKPGTNGVGIGASETKTHDEALTLKGNIFTREGFTQTGWATSDGGEKAYDLGGSYTANAGIDLYPVWTINNNKITTTLTFEDSTSTQDCTNTSFHINHTHADGTKCWSWNADNKTLTLNGIDLEMSNDSECGIRLVSNNAVITLTDGSVNTLTTNGSAWYPIMTWSDLTINGGGKLIAMNTTGGNNHAISVDGDLIIDGAEVIATHNGCTEDYTDACGISATNITIQGNSKVTASGDSGISAFQSLTIKSGMVTGMGLEFCGISANTLTLEGGNVTSNGGPKSDAIWGSTVNILGGTVTATAASGNKPFNQEPTLTGMIHKDGTGTWNNTEGTACIYEEGTTYTLTYTAGANGTITGNGAQTVSHGGNGSIVTATPNPGYHFVSWSDGVSTASRTDMNVMENISVTANFAADTYTVTYKPGTNGMGSETLQTKTHDVSLTLKGSIFTREGFTQTAWTTSDGGEKVYDLGASYSANTAIDLYPVWTANTYTVTYTAGANGTILGNAVQTISHGGNGSIVTATSNPGYHFVSWSDGVSTASRTDKNVMGNISVTANFIINEYTVTYTAGANGTILGNPAQTVSHGGNGSIVTATPNSGYHFVSWSDGVLTASRTDNNVMGNISVTANFAADTYTVTYKPGTNVMGSEVSEIKTHDTALILKEMTFTREGFIQTGWATSDGGEKVYDLGGSYTANATVDLYPVWTANTYTVTYTSGANGTILGNTVQTISHGGNGSIVTATPNPGYHFVSWSDGVSTASRTDMNVMGNISVTANFIINEYTVTYTAGANGTILGNPAQTVSHGGNGSIVTATPNPGYHFVSWSDGILTASRTDNNVMGNISVTANFAINEYAVTYTAGANGTILGNPAQTVSHGGNGSIVTATPNPGYHFVSWSDGILTASRTDMNVMENISVTANFIINEYTVTYTAGANGVGSEASHTKTHDVSLTLKGSIFTREGFTQTGWATSDGGGKVYDLGASYSVNETIDLYPVWTANTYTVTYTEGANGTILGNTVQTISHGGNGNIVTATPNSGYHFVSWSDGVLTASRTDNNVMGNISVTANFAADTYTVTYKPGINGMGSEASDTKTHDEALTLKGSIFTREGFTQTGWAISEGGEKVYDLGASYSSNATIDLHPVWTANTYNVTYTAGANGTILGNTVQTISHGGNGSIVTATPNPGYHFVSWSDGILTASRTDMNVMENISVTANFIINEYTVTYTAGANGVGIGASETKTHDEALTLKGSIFTREGFTQTGWATSDGGEKVYDLGASYSTNATIDLYPVWTADVPTPTGYTISMNVNGGNAMDPSTLITSEDGKLTSLPKPTRNGSYSFKGWFTEASGGTAVTTDTVFSADATIYAHWIYTGGSGAGTSTTAPIPYSTIKGEVIYSGEAVNGINAQVTNNNDGTKVISFKSQEAIMEKKVDGTTQAFSNFNKVGFTEAVGTTSSISMSEDGTIQIKNLINGTKSTFNMIFHMGEGQKIVIGKINVEVDKNGEISLSSTLIDPYGVIIDASTGEPITGVQVTLYYADTARNKMNGKAPNTPVELPGLDGFKPSNNQNPQISDESGSYAFMVYPTSDYYIIATKEGYETYKSMTISVEQEIVRWDFKMNKPLIGAQRLAGESRVDTGLSIAKANYSTKLKNVVLAAASNYPDALAGSVLAYKLNAPILLVGSTDMEQNKVIDYMKSNLNSAGTVYILGGTGAVGLEIENKISDAGFNNITRISGKNRSETALKIADFLEVPIGRPLILVNEGNYADALSVSTSAAAAQNPILLIGKDGLTAEVKQKIAEIKPIKIYLIGGEGVISTKVASQVAEITDLDQEKIIRIDGKDRYATSLAVAKYFGLSGKNVCLATGRNFPDALAGSVYAANYNAPVILVDDIIPQEIKEYLISRKMSGAVIFGGEGVIGKEIEHELLNLLVSK